MNAATHEITAERAKAVAADQMMDAQRKLTAALAQAEQLNLKATRIREDAVEAYNCTAGAVADVVLMVCGLEAGDDMDAPVVLPDSVWHAPDWSQIKGSRKGFGAKVRAAIAAYNGEQFTVQSLADVLGERGVSVLWSYLMRFEEAGLIRRIGSERHPLGRERCAVVFVQPPARLEAEAAKETN